MKKKIPNKNILKFGVLFVIVFCLFMISDIRVQAATVVPPYKYGDVNHNGVIDITDQLKIARHINASSDQSVYVRHPDWILTGNALKAADVNYDGKITSADIDLIVQHIATQKGTPGNVILTITLASGDSGAVYRCLPVIYNQKAPASCKYPALGSVSQSGFTFVGWYTRPSGGSKVTSQSRVANPVDHVLYSRMTRNEYQIFFHAAGGNCSVSSKLVKYGYSYGTLPTPTRAGYRFAGWYTASNGGNRVTEATRMGASSVTVYAHWTVNEYKLSFYAAGGNCSVSSKLVKYGYSYGTLPTPTRTGYRFTGWYTGLNGGVRVTEATRMGVSSVTVYAHWTVNEYKLSFHAAGGNCSVSSKLVKYGYSYGTLPTPTRAGYRFAGWYTASNGGNRVTETTRMGASSVTVYAHWATNSHTVTFNANGGKCSTRSRHVVYDSKYGKLPSAERSKYRFLGWYTAKSGGTRVTDSTVVKVTADQTLYAHWKAETILKLNKTELTLYVGRSYQLSVSVDGKGSRQKWSSSNSKVVSVNSSGRVKAKKAGTAKITVKVNGVSKTCIVRVRTPKKKVTLTKCNITNIYAKKQKQIILTWKKVSKATYYQIYRASSVNGRYQKIKTVSSRTTKFTDRVGNGRTFYYKIRAVRKYGNGYIYGGFSSPKKTTEIGNTWYRKVLNSPNLSYRVRYQCDARVQYRTVKCSEFNYYKITDLNGDGIKELLLSTNQPSNKNWTNKVFLLTYWGNKVKPLICFEKFGYRGYTYLNRHSIVLINSGSGFYYRADFTIKSGKLLKNFEMNYEKYIQNRKNIFNLHVNGKKVSLEEWNRVVEKNSLLEKNEVTYRRINR